MSLVALAVLGVCAATLSVQSGKRSASGGGTPAGASYQGSIQGFAGYTASARLSQVSATFRVPAILTTPRSGYVTASTWIGAQSAQGDFAQIGVTEFETSKSEQPQYSGSIGRPLPVYNIFWSDTDQNFHPVDIATVDAYDAISVSMVLGPTGWKLAFKDQTSGATRALSTRYGKGQAFNFAEFEQEDPVSSADPLRNLPYPALSNVTFSRLVVNDHVANIPFDGAQSMDTPGGAFNVPTRISSGSFTVRRASGYQRQYLSDVATYDLSLQRFSIEEQQQLHDSSDDSALEADAASLVDALGFMHRSMSSQSWPAKVKRSVDSILTENVDLAREAQQLATSGPSQSLESDMYFATVIAQQDADRIRVGLGLPPAA
jgi:hypothetical protein